MNQAHSVDSLSHSTIWAFAANGSEHMSLKPTYQNQDVFPMQDLSIKSFYPSTHKNKLMPYGSKSPLFTRARLISLSILADTILIIHKSLKWSFPPPNYQIFKGMGILLFLYVCIYWVDGLKDRLLFDSVNVETSGVG